MSDQHMPPFQADDSSSIDSTPANRLRALLERAELSQRGAARLLGIDERTLRMWCAGQGVPPAYVYRALDPRLTYREYLREKIEANERHIELLESGRHSEIPRDYRPADANATKQEIDHLRKRNEAYRSILRLGDSFYARQDAHDLIFQQWLTPGSYGLTLESIQTFDAAEQEFQSAKSAADQITNEIKLCSPMYALSHRGLRES
jgi:transcriptional regulator with XRE-family HTH domain